MEMSKNLTDEQVDFLLQRFDQTEPRLQRRIIAEFIVRLDLATHLLQSVNIQCGNESPGGKRHALTSLVRDSIRDFLKG